MDQTFEQAVETLAEYLDDVDNAIDNAEGFTFGQRVRVLEETEIPDVVVDGDEGPLIIENLHGRRTAFYVLVDGQTDPLEVSPDNIEPA